MRLRPTCTLDVQSLAKIGSLGASLQIDLRELQFNTVLGIFGGYGIQPRSFRGPTQEN